MGEVVEFTGETSLPLDPDKVLRAAVGNLRVAVVIGWDKEGEFYAASSEPSGPEVIWLLESCKKMLLDHSPGENRYPSKPRF